MGAICENQNAAKHPLSGGIYLGVSVWYGMWVGFNSPAVLRTDNMDQIHFACPYCKKAIRVKAEAAGKQGTCSKCHKEVTVPQASEPWTANIPQNTKNNPTPQIPTIPPTENSEEKVSIVNTPEFAEKVGELIEDRKQRKDIASEQAQNSGATRKKETGVGILFARIVGGLAFAFGVFSVSAACQGDASVNGTYNIGLLVEKQIAVNVGICITLVGLLLIIIAELSSLNKR